MKLYIKYYSAHVLILIALLMVGYHIYTAFTPQNEFSYTVENINVIKSNKSFVEWEADINGEHKVITSDICKNCGNHFVGQRYEYNKVIKEQYFEEGRFSKIIFFTLGYFLLFCIGCSFISNFDYDKSEVQTINKFKISFFKNVLLFFNFDKDRIEKIYEDIYNNEIIRIKSIYNNNQYIYNIFDVIKHFITRL